MLKTSQENHGEIKVSDIQNAVDIAIQKIFGDDLVA